MVFFGLLLDNLQKRNVAGLCKKGEGHWSIKNSAKHYSSSLKESGK